MGAALHRRIVFRLSQFLNYSLALNAIKSNPMKYLLIALAVCGPLMAAETITMDDLKILSEKSRHREVLQKAPKVPPTNRSADWEKFVTKAVKVVVDEVETDADREWAFEVGSLLTREHPHVKEDKELMGKMADLAVRTYSTKGIAAPYYAASLSKGDKKCSDAQLQEAITDAFVRPAFEKEKDAAKIVAFDLCTKEVTTEWARTMVDSDYGMKSACAGLLKLGKLTGVKKSKCESVGKGN